MSPFHSTACLWSFAYFGHAFHVSICLSSSSQPFSLSDLELCFEPNLWDFLIIGSHEADVRGWNVSSWPATWFFSTFVCLDSRVRTRVTCTNRGEEDDGGGDFCSTFVWTQGSEQGPLVQIDVEIEVERKMEGFGQRLFGLGLDVRPTVTWFFLYPLLKSWFRKKSIAQTQVESVLIQLYLDTYLIFANHGHRII